jgi:pimeloyl-ACP methyl ester carboxylesterase
LGQFTTEDGIAIAFDDEGEGRPLVLLHGLMAHRGFFPAQRALAGRFRLITIDLRGHGDTATGPRLPDVETLARDVGALAAELDLEGAVGIGWSLGAAVLWHLLTGPETHRFDGAVVVDMTPCVRNAADWSLGLETELCDARTQAIESDFKAFAAAAGAAIFAAPDAAGAPHPLAGWAAEEFARNDGAPIAALWSSLVEQDFRPRLAAVRQPTLVVHGALSHLYGPETAEHLAAALPRARALRFERSGHAPHLEQPELFNAALIEFAASLPPVRTSEHA